MLVANTKSHNNRYSPKGSKVRDKMKGWVCYLGGLDKLTRQARLKRGEEVWFRFVQLSFVSIFAS